MLVAALSLLVSAAHAAAPANDSFAQATAIVGETGTTSGTNGESSRESDERPHARSGGGRSVWYVWTAPFSGQVVFDTCTSNFDTVLAVYAGETLAGLSELAANDDACGAGSRVITGVVEGTAYHLAVDGFDGEYGSFTLRWRRFQRPANDDFASAHRLDGPSGTVEGTNLAATAEAGEPGAPFAAATTVWYAWTAPVSGGAVVETCGSSSNTRLAVYTGDGLAQLTLVAANDDACRAASRVRFVAQSGATYRIAVDAASAGDFVLSWAVAEPPANDDRARARRISGTKGSLTASNVGATAEAGEAAHGDASGGASVWFRWRAPKSIPIAFGTCTTSFDTVMTVYRRGTSALVPVTTSDDGCREGTGSLAIVRAKAGTVYLIALDGLGGGVGSFDLTWGTPPPWAQPCFVPNARGATLAEARRMIRRTNCNVGRIARTPSSIVPRDRVLAQFPEPGTRLRYGGRVDLEVSAGRRR